MANSNFIGATDGQVFTTGEFLTSLWGALPQGRILIWTLPDKKSRWYVHFENVTGDMRFHEREDVYTGVGLAPKNALRLPSSKRLKEWEVAGIAAFWADIDVAHPVHKKSDRLPPSIERALEVIAKLPFQATIIVDSGHGLQLWWALEEPWLFQDDEDRELARRACQWWHRTVKEAFAAHGWTVDSTFDLARVMRLPGTWNNKDAQDRKRVEILENPGLRYGKQQFIELIPEGFQATPMGVRRSRGANGSSFTQGASGLALDPDAEPSFTRMEALLKLEPRFRATWEKHRPELSDQSPSAYDMALANHAVRANWPDQEVANLLIAFRRRHGLDLKLREDYYSRTIAKAHEPMEREQAEEDQDVLDDPQDAEEDAPEDQSAHSGGPDEPGSQGSSDRSGEYRDAGLDPEEDCTTGSASTAGASQSGGDTGNTAPGDSGTPLKQRPIITRNSDGLTGALAHLGRNIRWNDRVKQPEVRERGSDWKPSDKLWEARTRELIAQNLSFRGSNGLRPAYFGAETWKNALDAYLDRHRVDPWREELYSKMPWDGQGRLELLFIETLGAKDCRLSRETAKRWLIASVARTEDPDSEASRKMDWMPVLVGPSGGGKSSVPRHLFPDNRQGWFVDNLFFDVPLEKLIERTYRTVIAEFTEMAGLKRQELEKIRGFAASEDDVVRLLYDGRTSVLPRRWVGIGTATDNGNGVLPEDPSGNRRWVVIETTAREGNRPHVVAWLEQHRDQIWAEASHHFLQGEPWDLPADLIPARNEVNAQHEPEDETLLNLLDRLAGEHDGTGYTLDHIQELAKLPPGKRGQLEVVPVLKKLGWKRRRPHGERLWFPPAVEGQEGPQTH